MRGTIRGNKMVFRNHKAACEVAQFDNVVVVHAVADCVRLVRRQEFSCRRSAIAFVAAYLDFAPEPIAS